MKKLEGYLPKDNPDLFRKPNYPFKFTQEPLKDDILEWEQKRSPDILATALNVDKTELFFRTLWYKVHQTPPENITLEIKGQTRTGKSSMAIFLYIWLCRAWGFEPTIDNIFGNQAELLYKLKDAKYGESYIVDEQTPETYSEGIIVETEQLIKNLNICAKKCNNIIFIYPGRFTIRGGAYGLETIGKDTRNKWNKCFLYDLGDRRMMGFNFMPVGYILIPKYVDEKYANIPMAKWSQQRLENYQEKHYDFDSLLEEQYEDKKNAWIEEVRNLGSSARNKLKEEYAKKLAGDEVFQSLKKKMLMEAYVQMKVNRKEFIELARSEMESVVSMAMVYIMKNGQDSDRD